MNNIRVLLTSLLIIVPAAVAGQLDGLERVRVLSEPVDIEPVTLLDRRGEETSLSDLKGRVSLVFFGFTKCPDVCPTTMARFRQLEQSGLVPNHKTAFVLISVDGDRDSPEVLDEYLSRYSDAFVGMTGAPTDVKALARQMRANFYKVTSGDGGGSYRVGHSPQAFVLDTSGRLRAELYAATTEVTAQVVNVLVAESGH